MTVQLPAARDGTAPQGRLRASTSGEYSGGERGLDFGRAASQEFVAVDGLFIQVMVSNLSALNRSLAEGVTRRNTVDDSANILA